MNPMNQRDLQQHVTILGWLYVVGHAIFLVIGAFVFLLLVGLAPVTGEPQPMWVLTLVGTTVGLLTRTRWGVPLDLVALGMLLYVSTYYTGILGQQGNTPAAVNMASVAIFTLIVLGYAVPAASRSPSREEQQ
jgi:hypothetical protein